MFEHHKAPLLPREAFLRRMLRFAALSGLLVAVSLAIGAAGYHWLGELGWIDATLNAAMILTGMGPVDRMPSDGGKLFAAAYALYSGVAFLTMAAVLFAPVVHRFFHLLHLEIEGEEPRRGSRRGAGT
jgi:hypothetical protein